MRKLGLCLLSIVCVCLISCGKSVPDGGYGDGEFTEVMDSIDLNAANNTSVNVKTKWTEVVGKTVVWDGEVVDVKSGRGGRIEIYVKKDEKPLYRGYNVIVTSYDGTKGGALKKGDSFTFKGQIKDKSQRSNGPLVIYIDNAEILD